MTIFEKYQKLITKKIERGQLAEAFIEKTITQLDYYLNENKLTQEQYNELKTLMNPNETEE